MSFYDSRPPVPAGWVHQVSPYGQHYYLNQFTGQTAPYETFAPQQTTVHVGAPPPAVVMHHAPPSPAMVHHHHQQPPPFPQTVVHHHQQPPPPSPQTVVHHYPQQPAPSPQAAQIHLIPQASSPKTAPKNAFVKAKAPVNAGEQDKQKARSSIMMYMNHVDKLAHSIAEYITPKSKEKSLVDRIKMKNGTAKFITLTTQQKNEILEQARKLLEGLNMFLFDFNKYGKTLPERDFSKVMLQIKNFTDNLNEFEAVVVKSETTKDALGKLKSKFSSINVEFNQQISYSNTGGQTADFSHHEHIQDHQDTILTIAQEEEQEGESGIAIVSYPGSSYPDPNASPYANASHYAYPGK